MTTRRAPPRGNHPFQSLPRRFDWLVRLAPPAACYASQLRYMLSEPEITALLSVAPQMRRVLRPLCRMLAVQLPNPDPPPAPPEDHAASPAPLEWRPLVATERPPDDSAPATAPPWPSAVPNPLRPAFARPAPA